ncbi:MAG: helix-turn-helix domain-containing protein [Chloroflexota bacterium]
MAGSDERETRILDAALELITHYGYDRTPVSEIAEKAGVSKGAIYLHFESKTALFEALLNREMNAYADDWIKRLEADPEGGTIGSVYKHTLGAVNANRFMRAIFNQDRRMLGKYLNETDQMFNLKTAIEARATLIRRLQEVKAVRADADPYVVSYLISVLVSGITSMDAIMPEEDIPPFDDLLMTFGHMVDSYLTTDDEYDREMGKQVIREVVNQYRRASTEVDSE